MPFRGTGVYQNGIQWSDDGAGAWVGTLDGPVRFSADPAHWREIACGIVHRAAHPRRVANLRVGDRATGRRLSLTVRR